MELWIRTQNGHTLMKCTLITLDNDQTGIIIYNDDNYMQLGGKYKSTERAMQVIDEIHNILQPRLIYHEPIHAVDYRDMIDAYSNDVCLQTTQKVEMELKQAGQFVYQMPKE